MWPDFLALFGACLVLHFLFGVQFLLVPRSMGLNRVASLALISPLVLSAVNLWLLYGFWCVGLCVQTSITLIDAFLSCLRGVFSLVSSAVSGFEE